MSTPPAAELVIEEIPQRKRRAETVAERLLEAIKDLEPGTRVPPERELSERFGVGRTTVREALNGLILLGAIEVRHGQGAFVAERRVEDTAPSEIVGALMKAETHEFIQARMIVEVPVARLAAENRTEPELEDLADTLRTQEEAVASARGGASDWNEVQRVAARFHVVLAQSAHNDILATMLNPLVNLMQERGPHLYEQVEDFAEWDLTEHHGLLDAVRAGDGEGAEQRMSAHITKVAGFYRALGEA